MVLIGASALSVHLDMEWRATRDLDLVLSVSADDIGRVLGRVDGWARERNHRWISDTGVPVDVIPAGPEALRAGRLQWPGGVVMSLTGIRLAFEATVSYQLSARVSIEVATVPVLVVLKMVSYLDRPGERDRDLEDLAHVLDAYVETEDERRYSRAVWDLGMDFDQSGAYVLGLEIGRLANASERAAIDSFLAKTMAVDDPDLSQVRMTALGPATWSKNPEELTRRLEALQKGIASGYEHEEA
jgi:predicted nucleotidyltransferase